MQDASTEAGKDTMFLIRVTHSSGMLEGKYTADTDFPPGDHRALAMQIERLLLEPDLLTALSVRARSDAVEKFSIERRIPEYVDVYNF